MPAVSAINPLRVGIDAALIAAGIQMHLGAAPRDAALPYVIVDAETEVEESRIGQAGHGQTVQLRCWADNPWDAQELYDDVKGALHGVVLTVAGHTTIRSEVSRITGFKEQGAPVDNPGPYCVVGRLNTWTLVA